jgi:hypothetical protein
MNQASLIFHNVKYFYCELKSLYMHIFNRINKKLYMLINNNKSINYN